MDIRNFIHAHIGGFGQKGMRQASSREQATLLHWKILVIVFLVSIPVVCTTSFFLYQNISRGEFAPVEKTSSVRPVASAVELFALTVKNFETKRVTFEQFKLNHPTSVDPSR